MFERNVQGVKSRHHGNESNADRQNHKNFAEDCSAPNLQLDPSATHHLVNFLLALANPHAVLSNASRRASV